MSLLDKILAIIGNSALQEFKSQCVRTGIEEFSRVVFLLSDVSLLSGLHSEWRKAAFRFFDCIYLRVGIAASQSQDRTLAKALPVS